MSLIKSLGNGLNCIARAPGDLGEYGGNAVGKVGKILTDGAGAMIKVTAATITGLAGTALSIGTLGCVPAFNKTADQIQSSIYLLELPYRVFMRLLDKDFKTLETYPFKYQGTLRKMLAAPIYQFAKEAAEEGQTFFARHVVSRTLCAVATVAAVVARTADLVFGVIAAAFSVPLAILAMTTSFEKRRELNQFALKHLTFFGVIAEVSYCARFLVNPQQFKNTDEAIEENGELEFWIV